MKFLLLLLIPSAALGATVSDLKPEDAKALIETAKAQGVQRWDFSCGGDGLCSVTWEEPKSGPVVYDDPTLITDGLKLEIAAIKEKILEDKATKEDIARVLELILQLMEK